MKRISAITHINISLVCIMVTLLFLAMGIGLVPNKLKTRLNARAKICENLAVQLCSVPEERLIYTFETIAPMLVERNDDILSLGIRSTDGELVASTQDHESLWEKITVGKSDLSQAQIPFCYDQKQAGTIEIYLAPLVSKGIYGYFQSVNPLFVLFMIVCVFAGFQFYLRRTLRHLNPSSVIPERVKAVLDTLSESVVMVNNDEQIVFANEAFLKTTSQSESDIIGRKLSMFPWSQQTYVQASDALPWKQTLQEGTAYKNIPLVLRKNDEELISLVNSAPIIGVDGEQRGIMASFTDVTELEQKNKELVKTSRSAGMAEVAANVLHNVGNVLNHVNTSANLIDLKMSELKLPQIREAIKMMHDHLDDLPSFLTVDPRGKHIPSYLIKTMDMLAKDHQDIADKMHSLRSSIEHIKEIIRTQQSYAKTQVFETSVSIRDLIEDAVDIDTSLKQYDISVIREFDGHDRITIDKARFLQILVNLVQNAKDALLAHNPDEKMITIRSDISDQYLRIEVQDNGIGIEPKQLTKIFRHGFTTKEKGSGFGLHSSALVAKEMGGSLTAHSDGHGCGAIFTLELPIRPERITNATTKEPESARIGH